MRDARFEDRIHLRSMIEEVAATYAAGLAEKGITFRNLVPETLPTLRGDAVRLAKLFDFLMRDGLALLEAGQHIEISAEASRAAETSREIVTIRVSDNGQGLSQEQLRRVFDPFAPRNGGPADLGINLMACFFIVHGHGGRIEAVSLPQGGTRYTITLPRDPTDALQKRHSTEFLPRLLLNQTSWEHYFGDDR
jgi:two-component system C4-dicarboxylate transport sensor histidine kinase DctB